MHFFYRCVAGIIAIFSINAAFATDIKDPFPLSVINRGTFYFNQLAYGLYIKPAARTYDFLLPLPVKASVHNFIRTMRTTRYVANDVLQGDVRQALTDSARFVLNMTLGLFGLFDVATAIGLETKSASMGDTFYKWGWKESSYLVVPLVGPSTIRDAIGLGGDFFLQPPTYFQPKWRDNYYILVLIEEHHDSKDVEDLLAIAGVNDYDFVRSSYAQHREYQLTGGIVEDADVSGNPLLGEPPE